MTIENFRIRFFAGTSRLMDRRQGTVNFAIEMDIYGKTHYLCSSETAISEIVVSEYNPDLEVLEHKIAAFLHVTGEFKGYKISYKGPFIDDM